MDRKLDGTAQQIQGVTVRVSIVEQEIIEAMKCRADINTIMDDMHAIRLTVAQLSCHDDRQTDRWKSITSFIIQLLWVVAAGWILYKLGLQAPP
jgi:hypothetical protein